MTPKFIFNNASHAVIGAVLMYLLGPVAIIVALAVYAFADFGAPKILKTEITDNYVIGCGINMFALVTGAILIWAFLL